MERLGVAEIYEGLGLQYIEPELREGLDEVERAEARAIPSLVSAEDLPPSAG